MPYEFISHITIRDLRNTPPCEIHLSDEKRQHLIITGPNGCGKTTLVKELYNSLTQRISYTDQIAQNIQEYDIHSWDEIGRHIDSNKAEVHIRFFFNDLTKKKNESKIVTDIISWPAYHTSRHLHKFLVYNSEAHRKGVFNTPAGPKALPEISTGEQFVQQLVNMKTQQAYLFQDMNTAVDEATREKTKADYDEILRWFDNLNDALAELFGHKDFYLDFDRQHYNYSVNERGKVAYGFSQLSDGYSAILKIVTDLMLAMSTNPLNTYAMPGIAIIDEIETHLHVELQQKILPFLTKFFPNIQFIVTTHSPFVLSSISNAVIFDMKSHQQYSDLSQYSYSNLVEGYFNVSQYSKIIIEELNKAILLLEQDHLDDNQRAILLNFDKKISELTDFQPIELQNRWLQAKIKHVDKFNGIVH